MTGKPARFGCGLKRTGLMSFGFRKTVLSTVRFRESRLPVRITPLEKPEKKGRETGRSWQERAETESEACCMVCVKKSGSFSFACLFRYCPDAGVCRGCQAEAGLSGRSLTGFHFGFCQATGRFFPFSGASVYFVVSPFLPVAVPQATRNKRGLFLNHSDSVRAFSERNRKCPYAECPSKHDFYRSFFSGNALHP